MLRDSTLEDAPAVAHLWHEVFHESHAAFLDGRILAGRDLAHFEARASSLVESAILAERNGELVGFAAFEGDTLLQLFVRTGEHGRGIGRVLLTEAERKMQEQGVDVGKLRCGVGNVRARGFYEAFGWRVSHTMFLDEHVSGEILPLRIWCFQKRLPK